MTTTTITTTGRGLLATLLTLTALAAAACGSATAPANDLGDRTDQAPAEARIYPPTQTPSPELGTADSNERRKGPAGASWSSKRTPDTLP